MEAIRERQAMIEAAGLHWEIVESVPVHEDLKTGQGDLRTLLAKYKQSLRNLAEAGIRTVVYNFMPVLDWVRTEMNWPLPSGARSLRFDPIHFAAFELYAIRRSGAEALYDAAQKEAANKWRCSLNQLEQDAFVQTIRHLNSSKQSSRSTRILKHPIPSSINSSRRSDAHET